MSTSLRNEVRVSPTSVKPVAKKTTPVVSLPVKVKSSTPCNVNFQSQYAFIAAPTLRTVTIDEYIEKNISEKPQCIPHRHELVAVRSEKRRPHFRHKHTEDVGGDPMTAWHAEWQGNFEVTEQVFRHQSGQTKERRADIVIPSFHRVVEIQHSKIEKSEVIERCDDYKLHGHSVVWILDGSTGISVRSTADGRQILVFEADQWRYENFKTVDVIYFDVNGVIYKVHPGLVRSHMVDICQPKTKDEFIEMLQTQESVWETETEVFQSKLILKQQGAGNGKTFGLMQMIDKDPSIAHYKTILLITKQHSAAHVMYSEFKSQYDAGLFSNIRDAAIIEGSKKYIISYKFPEDGETLRQIVIATVDSLMWCLGNKTSRTHTDMFVSIVESIKAGYLETVNNHGKIKYAGVNPMLNKEMLICIDETQDLHERYGDAMLHIATSTNVDICLVGDLLQSIHYIHNAFSELLNKQAAFLKVIKTDAINQCRRFNHPELVAFVNKMVPFEKFGVPAVEPAVSFGGAATEKAIIAFQGGSIMKSKDETEKGNLIDVEVGRIMAYFDKEVTTNGRVPEDFLVVTPFTSNNPLVNALSLQLNIYWKQKMEDATYIEAVKARHSYWKDVTTDNFTRFAIFHKSEEGNSIDLTESEHATRIVSIHSSKGDGRNVVFAIGISEDALKRFSQVKNNLIYESLLHVAITRQKQRLYFRYEVNNDDICRRIQSTGVDVGSGGCLKFKRRNVKASDIVNEVCCQAEQEDSVLSFVETAAAKCEIAKPDFKSDGGKQIIDWAHHCIRYSTLRINAMLHVYNKEFTLRTEGKKQIWAILYNMKKDRIVEANTTKEYYGILKDNINTEDKVYQKAPILRFSTNKTDVDYQKYYNIIVAVAKIVCDKIQSCVGKSIIAPFCPLESVVFYYMLETLYMGTYARVTMDELYNVVHIYDKSFFNTPGHEHCICMSQFKYCESKTPTEFQNYLFKHYERTAKLNNALSLFDKAYPQSAWLYEYDVWFEGGTDNFGIVSSFDLIAYDEKTVNAFYIVPQFNEINYNQVLIKTFFNEWILGNIYNRDDYKAYEYFAGKERRHWILSLDRENAFEINWQKIFESEEPKIRTMIYNILYNRFVSAHQQLYEIYRHARKHNPPQKVITAMDDSIIIESRLEYISKFLAVLENDIEEQRTKREKDTLLTEKYDNERRFLNLVDGKLEVALKAFLKLGDDEEDEDEEAEEDDETE
jgi:hypothetical protein